MRDIPGGRRYLRTSSEECEQAIFSWVEKKNVLGHQLVSSSPGVTREELKFLESWNLPLSIDNVNFTEGRRMFILPSGRICLNYLRNLGRDLKGRDGALLSHLIIMNTTTFLEMEGDFESMDGFHPRTIRSVSDFEKLKAQDGSYYQLPRVKLSRSGAVRNVSETLRAILKDSRKLTIMIYGILLHILKGNPRIVIWDTGFISRHEFLWAILGLFPPEFRIIPFTTYSVDPARENLFYISVSNATNRDLSLDFIALSFSNQSSDNRIDDPFLYLMAEHLSTMVFSGNDTGIKNCIRRYSDLSHSKNRTYRLIAAIADSLIAVETDPEKRLQIAMYKSNIDDQVLAPYYREKIPGLLKSGGEARIKSFIAFYRWRMALNAKNEHAIEEDINFIMESLLDGAAAPDHFIDFLRSIMTEPSDLDHSLIYEFVAAGLLRRNISNGDLIKMLEADPDLKDEWSRLVLEQDLTVEALSTIIPVFLEIDKSPSRVAKMVERINEESFRDGNDKYTNFVRWFCEFMDVDILPFNEIFKLAKDIFKKLSGRPYEEKVDLVNSLEAMVNDIAENEKSAEYIKMKVSDAASDSLSRKKGSLFRRGREN